MLDVLVVEEVVGVWTDMESIAQHVVDRMQSNMKE